MVKAIFFDIDGTLIVPFADKFSDDTLYCLNELKKKNIKLFISTGRPFKRIKWLKDLFEFDGYVTFNGQYVVDDRGEAIRLEYLDEDDIFNTIEYCNANKIGLCVYDLDNNYKNAYANPYTKTGWQDIGEVKRGNRYNQMLLFQSGEEEKEVLKLTKNIKTVRWNNISCDMILKSGGKEKGIMEILKHYNIKKEETMAFGDGGNDIDMLKFCEIGVAMGNAGDNVKLAADYVTDDVDKSGLLKALKHFNILD